MISKRKICFISPKAHDLFFPENKNPIGHGGAEVQMYLLAKEFAKNKNLEIHFVVATTDRYRSVLKHNIKITQPINLNKNIILQSFRVLKSLAEIDAAVYIQRTLTPYSWVFGLLCRVLNRNFVYMVAHDAETDGTHDLYNSFIGKFIIHLNFRLASQIIVQNTYEFNNLKYKYGSSKLRIIKKGIRINRNKKQNNLKAYDCSWVGRAIPSKKPDLYIKLARSLPKIRFLMVISSNNLESKYFVKLLEDAHRLANLTVVVNVSNKEVHELLSSSKMFCITSRKEGDWPMVVLEGCTQRLPILAYYLKYGLLLDKYGGGHHLKGSFKHLQKMVKLLSTDEEERIKIGENAYKYVVENHSIETNAAKLLDEII